MSVKKDKRIRRHKKIRKTLHGTSVRPRLCVSRSNQHIYAQLIDDDKAKVLVSASDKDVKAKKGEKKVDVSKEVGKFIAKKALESKIETVVFFLSINLVN